MKRKRATINLMKITTKTTPLSKQRKWTYSLAFCRLLGGSLLDKISRRSKLLNILSILAWISFSTTARKQKSILIWINCKLSEGKSTTAFKSVFKNWKTQILAGWKQTNKSDELRTVQIMKRHFFNWLVWDSCLFHPPLRREQGKPLLLQDSWISFPVSSI